MNNANYREVELPNESYILPWETYNDLRTKISQLEREIVDIRTKYEAFRLKYDQWRAGQDGAVQFDAGVQYGNEYLALKETLEKLG